jgi:hypothetical protein
LPDAASNVVRYAVVFHGWLGSLKSEIALLLRVGQMRVFQV